MAQAAADSKRARNQAARRERVIAAACDLAADGGYQLMSLTEKLCGSRSGAHARP